jgi:subtilase family serine protease
MKKPNISAPFNVNIPNIGAVSGTSISAPIVASCIAMIKEQSLKNINTVNKYAQHPERITSILLATADRTYDYSSSAQCEFDDKVGAGIINLERLLGVTQNQYFSYTQNTAGIIGSYVIDVTHNLTQGQTIQLGLSWLASVDASEEERNCTNYDLYIYNNVGYVKVASSIETQGTCELIRFTAPQTGTYRILVQQQSTREQADSIALLYNFGFS